MMATCTSANGHQTSPMVTASIGIEATPGMRASSSRTSSMDMVLKFGLTGRSLLASPSKARRVVMVYTSGQTVPSTVANGSS